MSPTRKRRGENTAIATNAETMASTRETSVPWFARARARPLSIDFSHCGSPGAILARAPLSPWGDRLEANSRNRTKLPQRINHKTFAVVAPRGPEVATEVDSR